MESIDILRLDREPRYRLEFLQSFVGFTQDDRQSLEESLEVLGPVLPELLDGIYDHLLSYDDTQRIFLGSGSEPDPDYIALRKEHITEWLIRTIETSDLEELARYLMGVASFHTGVAGDPHREVPPRYLVALTSFLQTAFWQAVFAQLSDDLERAQRIGLAWNKMLLIQLELFLKVVAPFWPRWDEPPRKLGKGEHAS